MTSTPTTETLTQTALETKAVVPERRYHNLVRFVKTWQSSPSVTIVCQKMGMKTTQATQMAVRMRHNGIPLKHYQRKGWNNRLLRELGRYAHTVGQPAHFVVGPMRRRIAYLEAQVDKLEQKLRARK